LNSLDAQRESAEAYVKSQAAEGWLVLPNRYDDGGFTGGNMDRPALNRLLADVETGQIDLVGTNAGRCHVNRQLVGSRWHRVPCSDPH
jgi:DNA invertase Pin-like site-specific DNA recombinase